MRKPILKEDNGTRHTVCFWFFSLVFTMIFQVEECSNPRSKSNKKSIAKKKIEEKKIFCSDGGSSNDNSFAIQNLSDVCIKVNKIVAF